MRRRDRPPGPGLTRAWPGFFVALEGPSGTGKTTLTGLLRQELGQRGIDVVATQEPTRAPAGELARHGTDSYRGLALACLVAADRYHHLDHVIYPALNAGRLVLCDRYVASSLVLQQLDGVPSTYIRQLNQAAPIPDLTVFLEADPAQARARAGARGGDSRFHRGGTPAARAEAAEYRRVSQQLARDGHTLHRHHIRQKPPDVIAAALLQVINHVLARTVPPH